MRSGFHGPHDDAPPLPHTDNALLGDLLWETAGYVEALGEAAIASRGPKAQQTISQMVGRLEKLGLIERRVGTGRSVGLYLTPAGHDVAEQAIARELEVDADVRRRLSPDRYAKLRHLLIESRHHLRDGG